MTTGNANWRLVDGLVEADMPRGYLVSKQSYGDFELRVDVWVTPASNAGVMLRITDPKDPGIQNAYAFNINDERKDWAGRTGSIVNVAKPLTKFDAGTRWTTVEIRAVGPKMTARLNGTLTAEATDSKYARGPIALQAAGGPRTVPERPDTRTQVEISASPAPPAGTPSRNRCGRSSP